MGVFQLLFIAITVAFPAYLWTRTSTEKSKTDWIALDRNFTRLLESDEGFPGCNTLDVIDIFHELCEKSYQSGKQGKAMQMERAGVDLVFSCLYENDNIRVSWRLEEGHKPEMDCREPGGTVVAHAPGFNFTPTGKIKSIEFFNQDNERERVPYRNCRSKAQRLKTLQAPPATREDFLMWLGKTQGDPPDYYHANMMCYTFDSSPLWRSYREKYFQ